MPPVRYHEGRFPPSELDWRRIIPLIGPAAAAVARYDGLLAAIPNPDVLLAPLTTQEAVLSSRIEGTQTTMGEVLQFEAGAGAVSPEKRADIQEVINYRAAMFEAERLLATLPLSQRVIREAHRVLMRGVRGHSRSPGEYRRIPNWIGPPGSSIENARFIPIAAEKLPEAMAAWERYLHAEAPDRLVQLAIIHAEFESLHPFLDGNGRLGRMIIPLFMWQVGLIQRPRFYISAYFEALRDEYYDALLAVSRDDDWTGWVRFFLEAVRAQAEENLERARAILDLYQSLKHRVAEMTRSQYAIHALDWIFGHPVFSSPDYVRRAGIPPATAKRLLTVLVEGGVLRRLTGGRGRAASVLVFPDLLNRAEGKEVF